MSCDSPFVTYYGADDSNPRTPLGPRSGNSEQWEAQGFEQRLVPRIAATQSITAQQVGAHIKVATDQPVRPSWRDGDRRAEQIDATTGIGASQEDDAIGRLRASHAGHRLADPQPPVRGEEGVIARPQLAEMAMAEALPELLLPEAIEAFDGGLETGFARRSEHRHDALRQAEAHETTQPHGLRGAANFPRR